MKIPYNIKKILNKMIYKQPKKHMIIYRVWLYMKIQIEIIVIIH